MTTPGPETWSLGRLLSTAARLVEHDWNEWLGAHGLTHAGLLVLHALDTGPSTQRQLAERSQVEEQTMGRIVDRLQRTGHVSRRRDSRDRRRVIVERTPLGDSVFDAVQRSDVSDRIVADPIVDPVIFRDELVRIVTALGRPRPAPTHVGFGANQTSGSSDNSDR